MRTRGGGGGDWVHGKGSRIGLEEEEVGVGRCRSHEVGEMFMLLFVCVVC